MVVRSFQRVAERYDAAGRWHVGGRPVFRDARGPDGARSAAHAGRRSACRRPCRSGRGSKLRLLAAAVRRSRQRGRQRADDRRNRVHDRRRDGAGVLRPRGRTQLRCRRPDQHRGARARCGLPPRIRLDELSHYRRPPARGRDAGSRAGTVACGSAGDPHRHDGTAGTRDRRSLLDFTVQPCARGAWLLQRATGVRSAGDYPAGDRGAGSRGRLRQCRAPADGARARPCPRAEHAPGAGSHPVAARAATLCRSGAACSRRGRSWGGRCGRLQPRAGRAVGHTGESPVTGGPARRTRVAVHDRCRRTRRDRVRRRPCDARPASGSRRCDA